ncbi:MAG: hypothetical protein ABIG39_01625 [Candidatus Micrarchaeota archaeon]
MASATFAKKVDILDRKKGNVMDAIQSSRLKRGFKDIGESLKLQTMASSLTQSSRRLDAVFEEIGEGVTVKKGKKDVKAWKEIASIRSDAMKLSYKEGKLHKKKNLKKLAKLVSRLENLESQLGTEQLPETYKTLCEVRERLEQDHEKFSPESYRQLKQDMRLLSSALSDIKKGATTYSWRHPFGDRSKHKQAISLMPQIIEAMKNSSEIVEGKPKSLKGAVREAVQLAEGLNTLLMELNVLNIRLGDLDVKDNAKEGTEKLKTGTCIAFFEAPKGVDPGELAARIVELNGVLEKSGLNVSESNTGDLRTSKRSITGGEYFSGSVQITRELSRKEISGSLSNTRKAISDAGLSLTVVDLEPAEAVKKKTLMPDPPKELSEDGKRKLVSKVASKYAKLKAGYPKLNAQIDESKRNNPITKRVLTMLPTVELSPQQLVSNAVDEVGKSIDARKKDLKMVPQDH